MGKRSSGMTKRFLFAAVMVLFCGNHNAFAEFDVDWGNSWDSGLQEYTGDQLIAQWLVDNDYYGDLGAAEDFASTGYIGYGASDPDPYFWDLQGPFTIEIVHENAGFADENTLGYYCYTDHPKTQIFSGTESGPKTLSVSHAFGLYIETPQHKTWYTDRNAHYWKQKRKNVINEEGGDPQAVIYELKPNQEWLIAWEDLDATQKRTDNDYNDMYVKLSATVVPEPVSSALFLMGGGLLTAVRARRRKKA